MVRGRVTRAVTAAAAAALVLLAAPGAALASPSPSPTSSDPLTAALAATGSVADQVAAAQKAYAAATAHLTDVQGKLSAAVAAYGAAQDALAARTAEADQAAMQASLLESESEDADRALRQQAALLYQGSPEDDYLAAVLGPDGPQGLSDLQVGMAAVLTRQDDARIRALALASDAERMRQLADAARAVQAKVAAAAAAARTAMQATVTQAEADTAAIAAQQEKLLARLAQLRSASAALEQQREDQLAALAGLPSGSSSAASLAKLYASGGGADLTKAQLDPQTVAQGMLVADGFAASQWPCLDQLWAAESGWNWSATNVTSGAYGIPQSLPGAKMAAAGPDWLVNPVTQIRWGLTYIESRYGSPCGAWAIWQTRSPHWY
jgi:hypothetical protein